MKTRKFKNKLVIGISGKKQNGKDTIADFLVNNYFFTKKSLATPLKEITKIAFGLDDEQVNDPRFKEAELVRFKGHSPRTLMQLVGSELFRGHFPTIWADTMVINIEKGTDKLIVIPDIRFPNELEVCDYVIRVEREGLEGNKDSHFSETALDDYEFYATIKNKTGELNNTYRDVDNLIKSILKKERIKFYEEN